MYVCKTQVLYKTFWLTLGIYNGILFSPLLKQNHVGQNTNPPPKKSFNNQESNLGKMFIKIVSFFTSSLYRLRSLIHHPQKLTDQSQG